MKRIITLTAALFISAAVFAQAGDNAPKEVKAWSGKAYAVHQESYTPSFDTSTEVIIARLPKAVATMSDITSPS